ncbi:carboxymuconolactone decarboxylase family protein [Alteraurantiacibacter aquimixticola]|uniref:Carboxymuconolactone decarboxylase family protein n=1 Tax=Alteraurantiacibacter aquimixticola TaxID=2489173 RepID=A0A4T3EY33_9SPHN|nr:peroxidase-related enzyme [Alteraurantiacibacter aquimixticola]TIX49506.1 carboxymuconolactone decarboxylase family protein [Alteraurantiacibacter aquimixticola]
MSRLSIPTLDDAPEASKPILEAVKGQLGSVPNMFRLIASSPAALTAYTGANAALSKTLDLKTRERIALAVAQVNGCGYCLSAHSYLATNLAKIAPEEVELARNGGSQDPQAHAAVNFARKVAEERGHVSEADIAEVRAAGFSEAQVVEIVALVAENTFTNYLNEVAKTDIDFPVVQTQLAA